MDPTFNWLRREEIVDHRLEYRAKAHNLLLVLQHQLTSGGESIMQLFKIMTFTTSNIYTKCSMFTFNCTYYEVCFDREQIHPASMAVALPTPSHEGIEMQRDIGIISQPFEFWSTQCVGKRSFHRVCWVPEVGGLEEFDELG